MTDIYEFAPWRRVPLRVAAPRRPCRVPGRRRARVETVPTVDAAPSWDAIPDFDAWGTEPIASAVYRFTVPPGV